MTYFSLFTIVSISAHLKQQCLKKQKQPSVVYPGEAEYSHEKNNRLIFNHRGVFVQGKPVQLNGYFM